MAFNMKGSEFYGHGNSSPKIKKASSFKDTGDETEGTSGDSTSESTDDRSYWQRFKDEMGQIGAGLSNMPASHKYGGYGKHTYNPIERFKAGYSKQEAKDQGKTE